MTQRQPGQIIAIFALSMMAVVGLLGLVLDGGNIYVQRRTAQNAADAAAMGGTRALLNAQANPDTTIAGEICKYATANAFGVVPVPTAYFVGADGVTNVQAIALPANCSGAASNLIPPGAVSGIHVDASIPFRTYLAGVIGLANVTAQAGATARVAAISGVQAADAPVAGCGVMMDTGGLVSPNIFLGAVPPTIDYARWMNTTFILQSSELWKSSLHPPCPRFNQGNGDWKGTIQGTGTIALGSSQPTVNGNAAAGMSAACVDAGMGDPANGGICYLAIPITDGNNPQSGPGLAHIVAFGCMQIISGGTGVDKWDGMLVNPRNCGVSQIYSYTYNWTWAPGTYTLGRIALTQ